MNTNENPKRVPINFPMDLCEHRKIAKVLNSPEVGKVLIIDVYGNILQWDPIFNLITQRGTVSDPLKIVAAVPYRGDTIIVFDKTDENGLFL